MSLVISTVGVPRGGVVANMLHLQAAWRSSGDVTAKLCQLALAVVTHGTPWVSLTAPNVLTQGTLDTQQLRRYQAAGGSGSADIFIEVAGGSASPLSTATGDLYLVVIVYPANGSSLGQRAFHLADNVVIA